MLPGPLWQWVIVAAVIGAWGVALAAWGGAFNASAQSAARDILRIWAALLFAGTVIWLALVLPGVTLSTITARRRGMPGLVGQGAALFWAGTFLVVTGLATSAAVWLALGGWPR